MATPGPSCQLLSISLSALVPRPALVDSSKSFSKAAPLSPGALLDPIILVFVQPYLSMTQPHWVPMRTLLPSGGETAFQACCNCTHRNPHMYKGPIRHMYMLTHTHLPCSAIWTLSLLADVDWGLLSQLST